MTNMAKFNKVFLKTVTAVVTILILVGCDPSYYYEVHMKNTTSQTITFSSIKNSVSDSVEYCHFNNKSDNLILNEGEKKLLIQDSDLGIISSEDITSIMKNAYPFGIVIKFENGDSLVYYPSGADKDFHSPYNKNSFFSVDKTDIEMVSEYDVLY